VAWHKFFDTSIFVPHFLDIYSALYFFYKSLWKRNKELEQLATNFLNLRLCGEGISFEKIQYLINIFCKLKCESTRLKDYFSELFNLGTWIEKRWETRKETFSWLSNKLFICLLNWNLEKFALSVLAYNVIYFKTIYLLIVHFFEFLEKRKVTEYAWKISNISTCFLQFHSPCVLQRPATFHTDTKMCFMLHLYQDLTQWSQTRCPRAACGPQELFLRPGSDLFHKWEKCRFGLFFFLISISVTAQIKPFFN